MSLKTVSSTCNVHVRCVYIMSIVIIDYVGSWTNVTQNWVATKKWKRSKGQNGMCEEYLWFFTSAHACVLCFLFDYVFVDTASYYCAIIANACYLLYVYTGILAFSISFDSLYSNHVIMVLACILYFMPLLTVNIQGPSQLGPTDKLCIHGHMHLWNVKYIPMHVALVQCIGISSSRSSRLADLICSWLDKHVHLMDTTPLVHWVA